MDPSNHSENISNAVTDDTEIMMYKKNAVAITTFKIVTEAADLETPARKSNSFEPEMAHQIFGDSEMIFGYRHLSINIYLLHNSAKCYLDLQASGKIAEVNGQKADDVLSALSPWLPFDFTTNKKEFLDFISKEKHDNMFGEVIETFKGGKNEEFKVTICNTSSKEFQDFHRRFESLLVWFIDGANGIDIEDPRWTIFYVYRESKEDSDEIIRSPVALCTVYKFYLYPDSVRPRISQFFVLPNHQRKGIATKFYPIVYNYLKALPNAKDITVEEPTPTFQKIRDFCDSQTLFQELSSANIKISTDNIKDIQKHLQKHKLCTKQGQRVFDILECLTAHQNGYKEYVKFTESIKMRIANTIEKENRGSKRLCNSERTGVSMDPINTKAVIDVEFARYVESLEGPVTRLRNILNS